MKILLSIKPQFVEKIMSGDKKYEFRKTEFKRKDVNTIIVYSSGPVKKVVGEMKFKKVLCDTPNNIWKLTHIYSGLSLDSFMTYFEGRQKAYAIVIEKFIPLKEALPLDECFPGVKAPQSFIYLDETKY